jgi:hypothetical protein
MHRSVQTEPRGPATALQFNIGRIARALTVLIGEIGTIEGPMLGMLIFYFLQDSLAHFGLDT